VCHLFISLSGLILHDALSLPSPLWRVTVADTLHSFWLRLHLHASGCCLDLLAIACTSLSGDDDLLLPLCTPFPWRWPATGTPSVSDAASRYFLCATLQHHWVSSRIILSCTCWPFHLIFLFFVSQVLIPIGLVPLFSSGQLVTLHEARCWDQKLSSCDNISYGIGVLLLQTIY